MPQYFALARPRIPTITIIPKTTTITTTRTKKVRFGVRFCHFRYRRLNFIDLKRTTVIPMSQQKVAKFVEDVHTFRMQQFVLQNRTYNHIDFRFDHQKKPAFLIPRVCEYWAKIARDWTYTKAMEAVVPLPRAPAAQESPFGSHCDIFAISREISGGCSQWAQTVRGSK